MGLPYQGYDVKWFQVLLWNSSLGQIFLSSTFLWNDESINANIYANVCWKLHERKPERVIFVLELNNSTTKDFICYSAPVWINLVWEYNVNLSALRSIKAFLSCVCFAYNNTHIEKICAV